MYAPGKEVVPKSIVQSSSCSTRDAALSGLDSAASVSPSLNSETYHEGLQDLPPNNQHILKTGIENESMHFLRHSVSSVNLSRSLQTYQGSNSDVRSNIEHSKQTISQRYQDNAEAASSRTLQSQTDLLLSPMSSQTTNAAEQQWRMVGISQGTTKTSNIGQQENKQIHCSPHLFASPQPDANSALFYRSSGTRSLQNRLFTTEAM